ncbi:unnamed protein product [Cylicocyclus nassatus]|uniref:Uncharacterized protein n=1 Tax=Cylicocyclus nassatus TaxID=53992 RepID=A0AA36M8T3_CYLNA|nr:unnamed protein product [Cylicocyclus nassatus]
MSAGGGLSREEFLVLQEQLIALRNRNYELQECLQKKNHEIAQLSSPKSEALQFASKLMSRKDKEKELTQKYESELDALRVKLTTQEEEFRLQQETLISELNKVVSQNQSMQRELDQYRACGSLYSSPQAGTPCESRTFVEAQTNGDIRQDTGDADPAKNDSAVARNEQLDRISEVESSLAEKESMVSALENKLLEYKARVVELESLASNHSKEQASSNALLKDKELQMSSLMKELNGLKDILSKKDEVNSHLHSLLSLIYGRLLGKKIDAELHDRDSLEEVMSEVMQWIASREDEYEKLQTDNKAMNKQILLCREELETEKSKVTDLEEHRIKEKTEAEEEVTTLTEKLLSEEKEHAQKMQALRDELTSECEALKDKISAMEETGEKQVEDRLLLLETRYQLEVSDREKVFEKEKEEWNRKLRALEAALAAKDEEKAMALKKQAALVKELQRALREEKKRAESLEKHGMSSPEERGWHLVSDPDSRSGQTLDGADSRSVSSVSALESDNAELISRLTALQRTHADAMDRINLLEGENLRLNREIEEKRELIEHWIRKRPLGQGSGTYTSGKPEGSLRRFLTTTLTGDDATNDVREMNRKLQRMLEETLSKNIILQRQHNRLKCKQSGMLEADVTPGGDGSLDSSLIDQTLNSSSLPVNQIELKEEDTPERRTSTESVLDRLSKFPYQVFVLSEYGRPIFVSCGQEDQLCSLFALIGVFVSRVKVWGDRLLQFSSGDVHVQFCQRSSLILCIVSRTYEQLDEQLNVLFDQIVSTLSRSQLDVVYTKKGDNYDLRRLLRGTDKYMDSSVMAWRTDISLLQTAIRIIPMPPSDRDFLSSTMASCLTASKLDGVLFGLMIAHRHVAAFVRLKRYALHPRDTHILLNLISGNSSLRLSEAQTWTPICLPNFNDKGFVYAFISFPWEGSSACLILLSVKKDHFDPLNEVKKRIVEKLENNAKFFSSFQCCIENPVAFSISQIGSGSDLLWSFVYKNRNSRQVCISGANGRNSVARRAQRGRFKQIIAESDRFDLV